MYKVSRWWFKNSQQKWDSIRILNSYYTVLDAKGKIDYKRLDYIFRLKKHNFYLFSTFLSATYKPKAT